MGSNKRYVIIKDIMDSTDSISLCNRMPTKRKTTSHLHVYARFVNVIAKRVGLGKPYPAAARCRARTARSRTRSAGAGAGPVTGLSCDFEWRFTLSLS